jgi:hypothetical protein
MFIHAIPRRQIFGLGYDTGRSLSPPAGSDFCVNGRVSAGDAAGAAGEVVVVESTDDFTGGPDAAGSVAGGYSTWASRVEAVIREPMRA